MYPFIHIGHFSIGTFGLCLWLASVCACWMLYKNFQRNGINADAVGVAAYTTVGGVVGAKLWHVLEDPTLLMHQPLQVLFDRAGFAWFGGLLVGIAVLLWQGRQAPGPHGNEPHAGKLGGLAMLDLAAPAVAVGYGVGRLGCLISGDGDYGVPTNLPWGMSFPNGVDPTTVKCVELGWPANCKVQPTPIYEFFIWTVIALILWRIGKRVLNGEAPGKVFSGYLILTGAARFLIEFIRINPRSFFGMSNAQTASLVSVLLGIALLLRVKSSSPTAAKAA